MGDGLDGEELSCEEALRPWMHVKDCHVLDPKKLLDGTERKWTLDLMPGVVSALQKMAAEGYEIIVTCKCSGAQAEAAAAKAKTPAGD